MTTPPPRPVKEPRNPAVSEPKKMTPVNSRTFTPSAYPVYVFTYAI